mgnify:CR=1 FL=1
MLFEENASEVPFEVSFFTRVTIIFTYIIVITLSQILLFVTSTK